MSVSIDDLRGALESRAAAYRVRTTLQPVAGPGAKVYPPTYGETQRVTLNGRSWATKYAVEERRINGETVPCVVLDSVASQANRAEEALADALEEGRLRFPCVSVDFRDEHDDDPDLDLSRFGGGDGRLTTLQMPHRLADALLRDAQLDGVSWRRTAQGRAMESASPKRATAIYQMSPTDLVFGFWDSTGGGSGLTSARFARLLASEIVAVGVAFGVKTASRIDPAGIELAAGPLYVAADPDELWTLDPDEAEKVKGKPRNLGKDGKGKPSEANHGNVKPSVDSEAGGVTMDYAEQLTVLSLAGLRRLRFPLPPGVASLGPDEDAHTAARCVLAALGLAAIAEQREQGYDLRSRCALVPDGPLVLELVHHDGTVHGPMPWDTDAAAMLLDEAVQAAEAVGLGWPEPLTLQPSRKLVDLIRRSRARTSPVEDA